jgi:hypothetical protein
MSPPFRVGGFLCRTYRIGSPDDTRGDAFAVPSPPRRQCHIDATFGHGFSRQGGKTQPFCPIDVSPMGHTGADLWTIVHFASDVRASRLAVKPCISGRRGPTRSPRLRGKCRFAAGSPQDRAGQDRHAEARRTTPFQICPLHDSSFGRIARILAGYRTRPL